MYQHIFPPDQAPTISFVGLPWKVVPFAQYELQAKWIARVLSGRAALPSRQAMHAQIQAFYKELDMNKVPKRCALQMNETRHRVPFHDLRQRHRYDMVCSLAFADQKQQQGGLCAASLMRVPGMISLSTQAFS